MFILIVRLSPSIVPPPPVSVTLMVSEFYPKRSKQKTMVTFMRASFKDLLKKKQILSVFLINLEPLMSFKIKKNHLQRAKSSVIKSLLLKYINLCECEEVFPSNNRQDLTIAMVISIKFAFENDQFCHSIGI
ncbi:hypothetical protein EGR_08611 [Echinococcus granulosus]|uniref:Uncharacterized protein n=1 Tax=Echinococcus granulosus TaxID=6210 RepID=W6U5T8_ECHGR|nr:hypothetical protein EGR_08611 [Echinococcus granulosus]EUB56538.1 hypothetical protein EGR_08611 [Echinococcus granulosus]